MCRYINCIKTNTSGGRGGILHSCDSKTLAYERNMMKNFNQQSDHDIQKKGPDLLPKDWQISIYINLKLVLH